MISLAPLKTVAAQLKIRFDGTVSGLPEHRLSLAGFGYPLALLLQALRRIATQMASNADNVEQPKKGGRFANLAKQLDIEIISIEGNSSGIDALVSFDQPIDELPLMIDLADRATIELLDSIEHESKGLPRNWAVRNYLQSLPPGVHKQFYELHDNGTSKKTVSIGDISFAELLPELPSLIELEGSVVGVGFEPGRSEVRVKSEGTTQFLDAADQQVEKALQMRKRTIRALGVHNGKRGRLLKIDPASTPRFKVTPEAVEEHIFRRWNGVFERLAKG
jgi:hypothetical protein